MSLYYLYLSHGEKYSVLQRGFPNFADCYAPFFNIKATVNATLDVLHHDNAQPEQELSIINAKLPPHP